MSRRGSEQLNLSQLLDQALEVHEAEVEALQAEVEQLKVMLYAPHQADADKHRESITRESTDKQHATFNPSASDLALPADRASNLGNMMENHSPRGFESSVDVPIDSDGTNDLQVSSGPISGTEQRRPYLKRMSNSVLDAINTVSSPQQKGLAAIRRDESAYEDLQWSSFGEFLRTLLQNRWWEAGVCACILTNALVIAVGIEMNGHDIAIDLVLFPGEEDARSDQKFPVVHRIVNILCFFFGVFFLLEVIIKAIGLRSQFLYDIWNYLDVVASGVWLSEQIANFSFGVSSQMFRLLRLIRLVRMLRLVRNIQRFDAMFIMTTAIRGSAGVLFWTFVLLSVVQLTISLILTQYLHTSYFDESLHSTTVFTGNQKRVYEYFGTFTRTFFSTFEMTLANWPPACRLLAENVTQWFFVFAVLYKLSIGFAVIGVVNGVFIKETFRVAAMDDVIMVRERQRTAAAHKEKMTALFYEAEHANNAANADGEISMEEWNEVIEDPQVRHWLAGMELGISDTNAIFSLLDENGSGTLTKEELIEGVAKLKGPARSIDVHMMMQEQQNLRRELVKHALDTKAMIKFLEGAAKPQKIARRRAVGDSFEACEEVKI